MIETTSVSKLAETEDKALNPFREMHFMRWPPVAFLPCTWFELTTPAVRVRRHNHYTTVLLSNLAWNIDKKVLSSNEKNQKGVGTRLRYFRTRLTVSKCMVIVRPRAWWPCSASVSCPIKGIVSSLSPVASVLLEVASPGHRFCRSQWTASLQCLHWNVI